MFNLANRSRIQPQAQERVDSSTVLGSLIDHAYVPGLGGLFAYDRKGHADLTTVQGTPGKIQRPEGQHYNDSNTGCVYGTIPSTSVFPFFMVVAGYFGSGAQGWCLSSFWPSAGAGGSARGDILVASATTLTYSLRNNFGTTATATSGTLTGLTGGLFVCVVAQSLGLADHRLYVNGIATTSTTSIGALTNPINRFAIGRSGSGTAAPTGAQLTGGVLFAGFGRRVIPDSLALRLSNNPTEFWNMFPTPRRVFLHAPAAGGVVKVLPESIYPTPMVNLGSGMGAQ